MRGGLPEGPGERSARRCESGQASLVALLVGVVIIGVLAWVFLFRHQGKSEAERESQGAIVQSTKKTIPGAALDQGKGVECANNLRQLRLAIQMEHDSGDETFPPSLQAISGVPASMKVCPSSGRPYVYNPRTGQVYCTTPGHERL